MRIAPEVAEALAAGRPVVALESTLISHGLPRPRNVDVARELEAVVRAGGAVPATVGLVRGEACVGLDEAELGEIAGRDDVVKCGLRDLAPAAALGRYGATTVAATAHLAARAGVRVFATGGLGGVHRGTGSTRDESADLETLARTGIVVVCAGVKAILDVGATLERLESLGVTVVGYGTDRFPGFYLADSGYPAPWRVDTPEQVAAVVAARDELGVGGRGMVVANPLPVDEQLDPGLHERAVAAALAEAERSGVTGKDVTPFLLERVRDETGEASLEANVRLVLRNAELAALVAGALVRR